MDRVKATMPGAIYRITVDGITRTHRDDRDIACEAARSLQSRWPAAKITVTDLRDGSDVPFSFFQNK
jgi:hypothetical protein